MEYIAPRIGRIPARSPAKIPSRLEVGEITIHSSFTLEETAMKITEEQSPVNDVMSIYWASTARTPRSMSMEACVGIRDERNLSFLGGCRLYPVAIAWSLVLSLTIVMEAYGKVLITSFFGSPTFRQAFGQSNGSSEHQISPSWQTALTNGSVSTEILGLLLHGFLTERFGYRVTMISVLVWISAAIFLSVFAQNIQMLLAAQILCGVPWGVIQTLAATYAAEVLPVALRAYLLSTLNMCWVLGQLISLGVVRATIHVEGELSYSLPFSLQWVWAVPLLVAFFYAPESPWLLIRKDKPLEARQNLQRLTASGYLDIDRAMAVMIQTNKIEKRTGGVASASYLDCFRGTNLRRTKITCAVWATQALCGGTFIGFAAYFFEQAGFDVGHAFDLNVGTCSIAILGNTIALILIWKLGRRTLYLWGLGGCIVCLAFAGLLSVFKPSLPGINWILGSVIVVLTFIYDMTIGPVCYILITEIPSTRMRLKTIVLARVAYNICMIASNAVLPRMLNPIGWNWKGKAFLPFTVTAFVCLIWCFFRLPETKGLAHIEMDLLFEKKASARKFGQFQKGLERSGYLSLNDVERSANIWHGSQGLA